MENQSITSSKKEKKEKQRVSMFCCFSSTKKRKNKTKIPYEQSSLNTNDKMKHDEGKPVPIFLPSQRAGGRCKPVRRKTGNYIPEWWPEPMSRAQRVRPLYRRVISTCRGAAGNGSPNQRWYREVHSSSACSLQAEGFLFTRNKMIRR